MAARRCARFLQLGVNNARFIQLRTFRPKSLLYKAICGGSGFLLCAQPLVPRANDGGNLQTVDPGTLTSSELIKNAAIAAINSASALLTQTVSKLMEEEEEYAQALERLIQLMELNLQILGHHSREDQVWDAMLAVRAQANQCKLRRQELQDIYICSEKMLLAASEAAHIAGAVYAGSTASERVHTAKSHLQHLQERSQSADNRLAEMEARSIQETSKYLEEVKRKAAEDDPEESESVPETESVQTEGIDSTTDEDTSESIR